MTKHPLAWGSFLFGAFFLAIVGTWVAQRQDVITPGHLDVAVPVALIVLGIGGIAATMWTKR